jgi:DNA repair exonuclease SbcCD ATPase subunit
MSSAKSNSIPSPESVHDAWLRQRVELEQDLFEGWKPITVTPTITPVTTKPVELRPDVVAPIVPELSATELVADHVRKPVLPHLKTPAASTVTLESLTDEAQVSTLAEDRIQHQAWLTQANDEELQQRIEHQRRVEESLSQQREAFNQDLIRLRAAFEQELADRDAAWTTQRDQEWAALQSAKHVQELAQRRLQEELAATRVREREELMQWRQQAEADLAEAHQQFEQERLRQQQEFARQRQTELAQLRRDREEFDARVRQVQSELAIARQRHEDDLRHVQDAQATQMRAERAELDKLRETWLEKFRREQVVLENGLQFFGQHLSRVSEELRIAQRGLQAVTESATDAHPTLPFTIPTPEPAPIIESPPTAVLSLKKIQERLHELRKPQRQAS